VGEAEILYRLEDGLLAGRESERRADQMARLFRIAVRNLRRYKRRTLLTHHS